MALNPQQQHVGQILYQLAVTRGLPPQRAREFVSAALAESGLRPGATNRSSGAGGLFQLLSPGYRQRAKSLGGVYNPRANALAILPDYKRYWQQHPHAAAGAAGAAVERSGQGAGFYSGGLAQLGNIGAGPLGAPQPAAPPTGGVSASGPDQQDIGRALLQAFQAGPGHGDLSSVYSLVRQRDQARAPSRIAPILANAQGAQSAGQPTPGDERVIASAKKWLGTPYVFGGSSKSGIDCSALLQRVWGDAGVSIPRTTYEQFKKGTPISKGQLRAGDAVFFRGSDARGGLPGHVGIYIGGGKFIEAPRTGLRVRVSTLAGRSDFVGARRYG